MGNWIKDNPKKSAGIIAIIFAFLFRKGGNGRPF